MYWDHATANWDRLDRENSGNVERSQKSEVETRDLASLQPNVYL
jgi:hypothetical protein